MAIADSLWSIKPTQSGPVTLEFTGESTVKPAVAEEMVKTGTTYDLVANYETVTGLDTEGSYMLKNGIFYQAANDAVQLKPFRVRLRPVLTTPNPVRALSIRVAGGTSDIEDVAVDQEEGVFYDLEGRRVDNPSHGFYILDGMKVYIK